MEGISEGAATVIEDNGCLSQQLLSKEGGWEEEEVQQYQLMTDAGCCHFTVKFTLAAPVSNC